jgi:hypothetical protein
VRLERKVAILRGRQSYLCELLARAIESESHHLRAILALQLACARARQTCVRTGMPWAGLTSRLFVSCFLGSSGCAWKSSIFRLCRIYL